MKDTNFIVVALSYVLDKFKAKHAGIYAIIMAILGAIFVVATYLQGDIGISLPPEVTKIIQIVVIIIGGLMGAHTPPMKAEIKNPPAESKE